MSTLARSAVLQGSNDYPWQGFPIGSTVAYALTAIDPATDLPLSLAGQVVIWTLSAIDARGLPILPALISHQATIVSAPAGTSTVAILSGDTAPSGAVLAPGYYAVDAWVEDGSGNRLSGAYGLMYLSPCVRLPGAPVTPGPPQQPIGQGNPHLVGTSVKVANYTAAFNDLVRADPTAGVFTVTLPAASSAVIGSADWIVIKHVSDSVNAVTVTPAGADTIDGLSGPFFVAARERLMLVSNGVGDWMVI